MLFYIPSPHTGVVHLGPLQLHMYGLTLLVAILACVWLTGRRWKAMGGEWDLVTRVAVWGVALRRRRRARSTTTSPRGTRCRPRSGRGSSRCGRAASASGAAILFGALAGAVVVRRAGYSVAKFLDAAAPGLLLAQGIGRIGNWWNQELYGKPTKLPWGLEISAAHRPLQYLDRATFHPTFLYELIWDFVGRRPAALRLDAAARSGRRRSSRSTSPGTASAASSRSSCGSTRRTTSPACA